MSLRVFFRADGNSTIGLGHVIRSLALAEMIKDSFECHFIIREPLPGLSDQILMICQTIIETSGDVNFEQEAASLCQQHLETGDIVVLDGYYYKTDYQNILKDHGCHIVCIDDIASYHFVADAIINHGGGSLAADYSAETYTRYYLGLRYALLRPPFRQIASSNDLKRGAKEIFVCMGGADPDNCTMDIIQKCLAYDWVSKINVIIGEAYQWRNQLTALVDRHQPRINMLSNLSAEEMADCMKKSGLAVTPPSTISYEYLSIGGELYLHQIADNQNAIRNYLTSSGLAFDFDQFPVTDEVAVSAMIENQKEQFDGKQPKRILHIFQYLKCSLRRAQMTDLDLIFSWINDPHTRAQYYNSAPVTIEEHTHWMESKLRDDDFYYYIAEFDGQPCGQVRFNIEEDTAFISYLVPAEFRGKGLGLIILQKAMNTLKQEAPFKQYCGYVKTTNHASRITFEKLGYESCISVSQEGSYKYTLASDNFNG